ncbi:MAG: VCBS repeat-containing protein, partial [Saprospiraceae bacterium]|nr:VCBS repeat-containing protein [Saprospiraceae bacterium]
MNRFVFYIFSLLFIFSSCENEKSPTANSSKLFTQLAPETSGITFSNDLKEDSIVNYFTYPYIYMGGGVAIGDVNNDGLQDIYFTGNMAKNALFLNEGNLKFTDISEIAQVQSDDRWVTGAAMADVNADGWMDIYVSVSGKWTTKKNQLFINQGLNKDGIPTFNEEAEERGVADSGNSTQATFFDYDKDGDIDMFLANYPPTGFKTPAYSYAIFAEKKEESKSDRLFQNQGDGTFKDVTAESGMLNFGLSLSATVGDFNKDGWEDIYVSNDFASPDYFFFNNGDGTFRNEVQNATKHTAFFGMGTDVGDINNDGLLDILQMDMTPKDNRRNKANMASMNIAGFWEIVNYGLGFQYMQNAVQLNNGIDENGLPHFSDISRITGMSSTDWSWAGLLADFDNDGWKDVYITNGTRRDINNKDYFNKIEKATYQEKQKFNNLDLTLNMPSEKIDNYVYKNNGDLTFEQVTDYWGLDFEGYSNGAAYADLDNDGDLEVIINNIDHPSLIFKNNAVENQQGNYLSIQLKGESKNPLGLGTKVTLHIGENIQYQECAMTRGFQSSVSPELHFGIGNAELVDKIIIEWSDGKTQTLNALPVNQRISIAYSDANESQSEPSKPTQLFSDVTSTSGANFKHVENDFDDFKYEILIPHQYSKNGSGIAVGDINGDQLEDLYIGGAGGQSGKLFLQTSDGTFSSIENEDIKWDANFEDMGALLFDADNDGEKYLYVVCGGNEYNEVTPKMQDKFYLNDVKVNIKKDDSVLPKIISSGSRVKEADYDNDGDLDLFVGCRTKPQSYPLSGKSYILKNELKETGKLSYTDVTETIAPDLVEGGMITDAVWTDYNKDGALDLIVVGEWMPITIFINESGQFVNKTDFYGLEKSAGWWYSVTAEDFDQDGDVDIVAGNLGLNYKYQASEEETFDVYASDYDKNGKLDIVLGYYEEGVQYPLRGRQCSAEQIPAIKQKYKDYNTFAEATLIDVYTEQDLSKSTHYKAYTFATSYIQNNGEEAAQVIKLPNAVQLSSINDIIPYDFNG